MSRELSESLRTHRFYPLYISSLALFKRGAHERSVSELREAEEADPFVFHFI